MTPRTSQSSFVAFSFFNPRDLYYWGCKFKIIETLSPLNKSSIAYCLELGRKIASVSGDKQEPIFLFQIISVIVQHFNSILLHNSFPSNDKWPLRLLFLTFAFNPRDLYYRRYKITTTTIIIITQTFVRHIISAAATEFDITPDLFKQL